jgi:hypothetical protein
MTRLRLQGARRKGGLKFRQRFSAAPLVIRPSAADIAWTDWGLVDALLIRRAPLSVRGLACGKRERGVGGLLHRPDHNGRALTYVYFEEEPGRRAAAKLLTRDGAQDHRPAGALMSRTMFAVVVVLLNTLSFTSLAYIANRKGYHAMAALAAAGAWLFGVTGGVLIWGIWR